MLLTMKRFLLSLFALSAATGLALADYTYLSIKHKDGHVTTVSAAGAELTVADGTLGISTQDGESHTFVISQLYSLSFTDSRSGVGSLKAEDCGQIEVYDLNGVSLGRYSSTDDVDKNTLPTGVYIIKGENITYKTAVKK